MNRESRPFSARLSLVKTSFIVGLICGFGNFAWPAPAAEEDTASGGSMESVIREQARDYEKAFAKGDAAAIAESWAENGNYIDAFGQEFNGRQTIREKFEQFFKDNGPQEIKLNISSIKPTGDDSAIERGTASLIGKDGRTLPPAPYTVIHVRNKGKWEVASCVEYAPRPRRFEPITLDQLEWLNGEWSAKGDKGEARLSSNWAGNKNFIVSKFQVKLDSGEHREDVQIIGYDPRRRAIVSWIFDSEGGTGRGRWIKNGDGWIVETVRMSADGHVASGRNRLEAGDSKAAFTWQTTNRAVDGVTIPDTVKIKVNRAN